MPGLTPPGLALPPLPAAERASRRFRRRVRYHRRGIAALLLGVAVLAGLRSIHPPAPPSVPVAVAASDLSSGRLLTPADVRTVRMPPDSAPAHTLPAAELIGHTLAAPVRRGEPLTDRRVTGERLFTAYSGVVTPVRLTDPGVARFLRVGQHIDLIAGDPQGSTPAETVATDVVVVAIAPATAASDSVGFNQGRLILVATAPDLAIRIADAAASKAVTVAWNPLR